MSESSVRINRCVCHDVTFAELNRQRKATGSKTVAELREHAQFGTDCRTCVPYVRRMLQTGETVFTEIISGDAEAGG